jgi:hypothetical protein
VNNTFRTCEHWQIASIIMVHGLKGHPYKTGTLSQASDTTDKASAQPTKPITKTKGSRREGFKTSISSWRKVSSTRSIQRQESTGSTSQSQSHIISDAVATKEKVFWPVDLLSKDCGKARILTFGYDTKVTNTPRGQRIRTVSYLMAKTSYLQWEEIELWAGP